MSNQMTFPGFGGTISLPDPEGGKSPCNKRGGRKRYNAIVIPQAVEFIRACMEEMMQ